MVYGGLKNCSIQTYIPRNISVMRKYFPALSSADSPWSHAGLWPTRNPAGGALVPPVATGEARCWVEVVENADAAILGVAAAAGVRNSAGREAARTPMNPIRRVEAAIACLEAIATREAGMVLWGD